MTSKLFELKAIKVNERMSEETFCYSANVYYKGKKVGEVSNHGHGGCDMQHVTDEKGWAAMEAEIAKLPTETKEVFGRTLHIDQDVETLCWERVADFLQVQDFRKSLRGKIGFFDGEWNGSWQYYPTKNHGMAVVHEHVKRTHPDATILNDLSFDELVELLNSDDEGKHTENVA